MPDEILHTSGVEDVPAAELNRGIRAEFTGVTNIAEVILGWQRRHSLLHSYTIRLKAWQASFLSGNASALVFALLMHLLARIYFCNELRLSLLLLVLFVVEYGAD